MNPYLGGPLHTYGSGTFFLREDQIQRAGPDRVFIFVDEHEDTINNGEIEIQLVGQYTFGLPASRHGKGAVFAYASGSVRFKKWTDPRTSRPVVREAPGRIEIAGNPDIAWLRQHLTIPSE